MSQPSSNLVAATTALVACDFGEQVKALQSLCNGTASTGLEFPTEAQMPALAADIEAPSEFVAKLDAAKSAVGEVYAAFMAMGE